MQETGGTQEQEKEKKIKKEKKKKLPSVGTAWSVRLLSCVFWAVQ